MGKGCLRDYSPALLALVLFLGSALLFFPHSLPNSDANASELFSPEEHNSHTITVLSDEEQGRNIGGSIYKLLNPDVSLKDTDGDGIPDTNDLRPFHP